jgi:hypothetical protein
MSLHLTQLDLRMQECLYGSVKERIAPVSDIEMWSVLRELRAANELKPFRIWLVGSRVEAGMNGSDVDLVLSPRVGFSLSDHVIERALRYCRNYGLFVANPACVLDPCFRLLGPTVALVPLSPHMIVKTVKLLSPRLTKLIVAGRIREYRRLGDGFSVEFLRQAKDTDYYRKLPKGSFDGLLTSYLRPAIEVPYN